jgi:Fe-S cluster biogenesis protein NfuA/nitrite reductase/ring-hydroxylating ferredoxin subunit
MANSQSIMQTDLSHLITQNNITQVRLHAEKEFRSGNGHAGNNGDGLNVEELNRQTQRIEELVAKIENLPDPEARTLLQDCLQETLDFYGKGLERIMEITHRADKPGETLHDRLAQDPFVSGLLLIHGLHPLSLEARLQQALDKVRPYMDSHGGSVEVVSLENDVAHLRLQGSCKGCPSSAMTLELAIKEAIEEACPDLLGLEVEGVVPFPETNGKPNDPHGWTVLAPDITRIPDDSMKTVDVAGRQLLICKVNSQLYAYRNECPGCGLPLHNGYLEDGIVKCKLGHAFEVQFAGKCTDDPAMFLGPYPLLVEQGVAKVAVK